MAKTVLCAAGWIVGLVAGLAGCHSTASLTPQEATCQHIYLARRAHCHEENDLAFKKALRGLCGLFDRKTLSDGAPTTNAAVRQSVLAREGRMPGFSVRFTEERLAALLAYLPTGSR